MKLRKPNFFLCSAPIVLVIISSCLDTCVFADLWERRIPTFPPRYFPPDVASSSLCRHPHFYNFRGLFIFSNRCDKSKSSQQSYVSQR